MVPATAPTTPRQQAWIRALNKAQALGTTPVALGNGYYHVIGSCGAQYTVRRIDPHALHFACDCPAGSEHRPCYHAAAVAALPAEAALRRVHRARMAGTKVLTNSKTAA
jgi:hypothetical protein